MCEAYRMQMTQKEGYVWFLPGWFKERWFDIDLLRLAFPPLPLHYFFLSFLLFFPRLSPFYVTTTFIKNIQHYIISNLQNKNKAKIICIIALNNNIFCRHLRKTLLDEENEKSRKTKVKKTKKIFLFLEMTIKA